MKSQTVNDIFLEEILNGFGERENEDILLYLQEDPRYKQLLKKYERIRGNISSVTFVKRDEREHTGQGSYQIEESYEGQELYLQGLYDGVVLAHLLKEFRLLVQEYLQNS